RFPPREAQPATTLQGGLRPREGVFTMPGIAVHDPGTGVHNARNGRSGWIGISVQDGPAHAPRVHRGGRPSLSGALAPVNCSEECWSMTNVIPSGPIRPPLRSILIVPPNPARTGALFASEYTCSPEMTPESFTVAVWPLSVIV